MRAPRGLGIGDGEGRNKYCNAARLSAALCKRIVTKPAHAAKPSLGEFAALQTLCQPLEAVRGSEHRKSGHSAGGWTCSVVPPISRMTWSVRLIRYTASASWMADMSHVLFRIYGISLSKKARTISSASSGTE